ncbi:MAG: hypothetical protein VCE74_22040 [Alphaproteobacteria bacterium]
MAVGLLNEAVHHAQAKARALADFLGGEKGIEDTIHVPAGNSNAVVGYHDHDIVAAGQFGGQFTRRFSLRFSLRFSGF